MLQLSFLISYYYFTCTVFFFVGNFAHYFKAKAHMKAASRNIKKVVITIPNEIILKRVNSTFALNRLSRSNLIVGENEENVNHSQFAEMCRLYPLIGVNVKEIK